MLVLMVSVFAALLVVNYLIHRDLLYPGLWHSAVWFVTLATLAFNRSSFLAVSDDVLLLLLAGALAFSVGSFVATYRHKPWLSRNWVQEESLPSGLLITVSSFFVMAGFVAYALRARALAVSGPMDDPFVNLRYAVSVDAEGTGGLGIYAYLLPLAYSVAAATLLSRHGTPKRKVPRLLLVVMVLVAVGYGFLTLGRGFLILLSIVLIGILMVLRIVRPSLAVIGYLILAVILFAAGGLVLGKGGSLQSNLGENLHGLYDSLVLYIAGSLPALSIFLYGQTNVDWGLHTFRFVLAVLRAIGFHVEVAPIVQLFVAVPAPTNLYTAYQPYIQDFGIGGAVVFQGLFGFIHGYLYRKATLHRPRAIHVFFFALSMFALITQFGPDSYFSLASMWLQFAVYGWIFFYRRSSMASAQKNPRGWARSRVDGQESA